MQGDAGEQMTKADNSSRTGQVSTSYWQEERAEQDQTGQIFLIYANRLAWYTIKERVKAGEEVVLIAVLHYRLILFSTNIVKL